MKSDCRGEGDKDNGRTINNECHSVVLALDYHDI